MTLREVHRASTSFELDEGTRIVSEHSKWLCAGAIVIERDDIKASLLRPVMRGRSIVSRKKSPSGAFATVVEAGNWLVPSLGHNNQRPTATRDLIHGVETLRSQMAHATVVESATR